MKATKLIAILSNALVKNKGQDFDVSLKIYAKDITGHTVGNEDEYDNEEILDFDPNQIFLGGDFYLINVAPD